MRPFNFDGYRDPRSYFYYDVGGETIRGDIYDDACGEAENDRRMAAELMAVREKYIKLHAERLIQQRQLDRDDIILHLKPKE